MNSKSNIRIFAEFVTGLCACSPAAPDLPLRWTVIANPRAGGFTMPRRWKSHRAALEAAALKAAVPDRRRENVRASQTALDAEGNSGELSTLGLVATSGPGHAGRITEALLREAAAETPPSLHLVICAGGDGTSLEVQSRLHTAPPGLRDRFVVIRMPLGTGNDGADSREMADALDLLILPTEIVKIPALRLTTATEGKGPFLAFNILSVGLDAFVTHMTNKMKGRLPGDSYKLWVDIAALFYDRIYKVTPMEICIFDGGEAGRRVLHETPLLLAVGADGRRTYGSGQRILPDDRNVCIVRQMPLLRKLALKELIRTGRHADAAEILLCGAGRVEFRSGETMLAQMDGETVPLLEADFPAAIELTEPSVQILKRK
jgi:diacylglycerol kinase family enzyme